MDNYSTTELSSPQPSRNYKKRDHRIKFETAVLAHFHEMRPPLTVRNIYYAMTVKGIIPKTEGGYRTTCDYLRRMRIGGVIPYYYIADNTRWRFKPDTYPDLNNALATWQQSYRRDYWADQPEYVEIWIEKDALASVINPITQKYDVSLFVTRGYSSLTLLYNAAEHIKEVNKPTFIYHFGDFDPSGVDAGRSIEESLANHGVDIQFKRMAVTEKQIEEMKLPTRPTKVKDPRAKNWGDKPSVELDSIPANVFRALVESCILNHIDFNAWEETQITESRDLQALEKFNKNYVLA